MQEFIKVTGMVIGAFSHGEYDKRIVILTKERGKITAFANGARRQGSRFGASTEPFVFGEFELFAGKNSNTLQNVKVLNYFEFLRNDLDAVLYAMFFLELTDYYAVENSEEALLLLLLYRALQGLKSEKLSNEFVKTVFEIKTYMIEGEFIPIDEIGSYEGGVYSIIRRIEDSSIEKLFDFCPEERYFENIREIARLERHRLVEVKLKSLELIEGL